LNRFTDGGGEVGVVGVIDFFADKERDLREGLLLKYDRSLADALRRAGSSRMELRVDELHFDLKTLCPLPNAAVVTTTCCDPA
jgi:hypothetical protein